MYEITVEHEFCAAHALLISGAREHLHGHNWRVTATLAGQALDADGLLCDFHAVEHALKAVCAPFANRNLGDIPPFDRLNPTAEHVAMHIAASLADALSTSLPPRVRVQSVRVTEAPGCTATFRPAP